jgi:hypothetical protein
MWGTVLGLMMQRLAARLGTVTGLHQAEVCYTVLIYVQAAVGVDVGNRPGSDDATVGYLNVLTLCSSICRLLWVLMWATVLGLMMQRLAARLGTAITEPCVDCVQAAVGVDVENRVGSDDATVGGLTGHSHRPSSSRGLLHCSHLCAGCCGC